MDRFDEQAREWFPCCCHKEIAKLGEHEAESVCNLWRFIADALRETWDAAIESAAKLSEPEGKRPCDCDRCDCGNSGNLEAVSYWDTSAFTAKGIRSLKSTTPRTSDATTGRATRIGDA